MTDVENGSPTARRITSVEIGRRAGGLCWVFGLTLVAAGGVATFMSANQAGTTALILFGGLLLFIAITKRVPLLIEVGTAKFDTSYEALDEAFEAGRESAVDASEHERTPNVDSPEDQGANEGEPAPETETPEKWLGGLNPEHLFRDRYRGAVAAAASGVTYRQLDYWARTELVGPSGRDHSGAQRLYTFLDIVRLRIVKELLDSGLTLPEIRGIIEWLGPFRIEDLLGSVIVHDRQGTRLMESWNVPEPRSGTSAVPKVVVPVGAIVDSVLQRLAYSIVTGHE